VRVPELSPTAQAGRAAFQRSCASGLGDVAQGTDPGGDVRAPGPSWGARGSDGVRPGLCALRRDHPGIRPPASRATARRAW